MSELKEREPSGNPAFGCIIFVVAAVIFGGLVLWSAYTFFRQDREIGGFTQDEKVPTEIVGANAAAADAILGRLEAYGEAAGSGETAELELTPHDLNLMISNFESLAEYQGMVHFTGVEEGGPLSAEICFPMRRAKFWEERYLVGEAKIEVIRADETVQVVVEEVVVPGAEIPEGFNRNFAHWLWLQSYQKDEKIGPIMIATSEVEMKAGKIVFRAIPGSLPVSETP